MARGRVKLHQEKMKLGAPASSSRAVIRGRQPARDNEYASHRSHKVLLEG
jgi:hypothetical protein